MVKNINENPSEFKPEIDQVLIELTGINGKSLTEVREVLNSCSVSGLNSFWYMKKAALRTLDWSYKGAVKEVLGEYGNWGSTIFEKAEDVPFLVEEDDDYEDDMGVDSWPVYLEDYPMEAHAALKQDFYLDGGNGDVLGVFKKEEVFQIFLATNNSYQLIAKDPIEWIQKTKQFVTEILNRKG